MISKKYTPINIFVLFLISAILKLSLSDCPISYYPEETFVGSIRAYVDTSISKIKQQQYTYNLVHPLTSNSPKVAIMISSLNYNAWGNLNFNIFYKATPSFSRLVFLVNVTEEGKNKWDFVHFSFFATQNRAFEVGSQIIQNFTNTQSDSKKLAVARLPMQNFCQKPVIKVFLNGLKIQSNATKQQVDQIKTQIEGYRSLTWSASVVRFLQKKITERETLEARLSNISLFQKNISFFIELGFRQTLSFFSFSFVIFTANQNLYRNQFVEGRFNQTIDFSGNFPSLARMDMFLLGLQGFKSKQWQQISLNSIFANNLNNQTFSVRDDFKAKQNSFSISYFAISKTKDSYCLNCRDGNIVFQNYCVAQCPQSYVQSSNEAGFYCEFCDIKMFKVPNKQKDQCICALQYYSSSSLQKSTEFTCSACNYQCLTCQSEYKCLTCDNNHLNTYRIFDDKNQCICANGHYDDGQNNIKCLRCHPNCTTCKGPSLFDCQTCPKGRVRGLQGNCICQGNFVQKNGTCVCESPNFNYKGNCFTFLNKNKCGQNQVQIALNGSSKCECKPNFSRFKTICVLCKQNQTADQQTGRCICKKNFYKDQSQNSCLDCGREKYFDSLLKKCVCIKGTFENSQGACITCRRRQTLISDKCRCIYNYFRNDWGQCQRCQKQSSKPQCQINSQ